MLSTWFWQQCVHHSALQPAFLAQVLGKVNMDQLVQYFKIVDLAWLNLISLNVHPKTSVSPQLLLNSVKNPSLYAPVWNIRGTPWAMGSAASLGVLDTKKRRTTVKKISQTPVLEVIPATKRHLSVIKEVDEETDKDLICESLTSSVFNDQTFRTSGLWML